MAPPPLAPLTWQIDLERTADGRVEVVGRLRLDDGGECLCRVRGFTPGAVAATVADLRWPAPADLVVELRLTGTDDHEAALLAARAWLEACESETRHHARLTHPDPGVAAPVDP